MDGSNKAGVIVGAGPDVVAGSVVEREDGVAMRVAEGATVDKPLGTQAAQRTKRER